MKFPRCPKSDHVASKAGKSKQALMQLLEPRRLMSLSGTVEYLPVPEAPSQFVHSFGFENHLPEDGLANPPLPTATDPAIAPPDSAHFDVLLARAIAANSTISVTTSATPNAVVTPPAASLSELYATLHDSTVAEIDKATVSTANETRFDAKIATSPAATTTEVPAIASGPSLQTSVSVVGSRQMLSAGASKLAAWEQLIPPAVSLPPPVLETASLPATDAGGTSHISLQAVEAELQAVATVAREVVSQMGRDIAIELAHLVDGGSVTEALIAPWDSWHDTWRIATLTGATVAAIAYLQSETQPKKSKAASAFSNRLIETVLD